MCHFIIFLAGFATGLGTTAAAHTPLRAPLAFSPPPPPPPPPPASSSGMGMPSSPLNVNVRKGRYCSQLIHFFEHTLHNTSTYNTQNCHTLTRTSSCHSPSPHHTEGMHRHDSFAGDDSKQHSFYLFNGLESIASSSSSHALAQGLGQGRGQGQGQSVGRRAALTPFKMRIRSSENAIGKPIAMHRLERE